ncbi:MAG: hypothetical protein CHACPFDD_01408 [Phycisphaerae bacterium]|nr:hypothetical protein [Phycisphaerae bacterium]
MIRYVNEISDIGPTLVGRIVQVATKPEWGRGTVLRVQTTHAGGHPQHRVSIQFAVGHRQLLIPPGSICEPADEPERAPGWIDAVACATVDDRLRRLPLDATQVLGTLAQRLAALAPHFCVSDDERSLLRWARAQTGVGDPLSRWTRDELQAALAQFERHRDGYVRELIANARAASGPAAVDDALATLDPAVREKVRAAFEWRVRDTRSDDNR